MSRTLSLPDDLYRRLDEVAARRGVEIPDLLADWLAAHPDGVPSSACEDEDLLVACTHSLLQGEQPPIAVDWKEITAALGETEPIYATVEEAMSALRRRPWTKDSAEC